MTHRPQNNASYPPGKSVVSWVNRRSRVRTTSVSRKITFLSLQRPGHHYKMDKSTQGLPRHPLGAGLGLGSRDRLSVSGVNTYFKVCCSIFTNVHTPQQTSKLAHMHPTCSLRDAVCMGALGEPMVQPKGKELGTQGISLSGATA